MWTSSLVQYSAGVNEAAGTLLQHHYLLSINYHLIGNLLVLVRLCPLVQVIINMS